MLFKKHYPCLDVLRSIAIILVMLMHFNERFYPLPKTSLLNHLATWGWNGVGLFFALSGFLIGGQIIEELRAHTFNFKRFYIKRFWRIFPPYYVSLLVIGIFFFTGVLTTGADTSTIIKTFVYHIFYLQNYLHLYGFQLSLYWSLAIEEQFYILAPLFLFLLWKYFRAYSIHIMAALILLAITMRFVFYTPNLDWPWQVRYPFHTRFDSLLFGVLASYLFIAYNDKLLKLSTMTKGLLLICSFAAIGVCLVYGKLENGYFNTCWQFTLSGFGFTLLTLSLTISSFDFRVHAYVQKFFALVAKLSYTMYLYHLILLLFIRHIISSVHRYFNLRLGFSDFLLWFCVYFLAVLAASWIIYRIIDRPSMSYRKKIIERMKAG